MTLMTIFKIKNCLNARIRIRCWYSYLVESPEFRVLIHREVEGTVHKLLPGEWRRGGVCSRNRYRLGKHPEPELQIYSVLHLKYKYNKTLMTKHHTCGNGDAGLHTGHSCMGGAAVAVSLVHHRTDLSWDKQ